MTDSLAVPSHADVLRDQLRMIRVVEGFKDTPYTRAVLAAIAALEAGAGGVVVAYQYYGTLTLAADADEFMRGEGTPLYAAAPKASDEREASMIEHGMSGVDFTPKASEAAGRTVASEHVRELIGKLDQWRYCMSHNVSYFGEPAGLVKSVVAELAHAVDPIYPPKPEPVDPLARVVIHTTTVPYAAKPAPQADPAPPVAGEDRLDTALTAYNKADYQWTKLSDPDEPRHRYAMRAVLEGLGNAPA